MKLLLSLCAIFFVHLSFGQINDNTMGLSLCQSSTNQLSKSRMARGPRNFIPNGNFNTGSSGSSYSNVNYAYWTPGTNSWGDTYAQSYPRDPGGIPAQIQTSIDWGYYMYWRNESSVWQALNVYAGYMYADLYRQYGVGVEYRNYILIELTQPLVVGTDYTFEANFSSYNSTFTNVAPSNVNLQLDRIGFVLTDSIPSHIDNNELLLTPFYETEKDTIIDVGLNAVNMTITGNGERYLVIGVFHETDSLTFNTTPTTNSHATYAFDNLKIYDPLCGDYGNVYLDGDVTSCPGTVQIIQAQHGISPWTWTVDGVTLPDTVNNISMTTSYDTVSITVQSGAGVCVDQDSIMLIPKYYAADLGSDTSRFCDLNVLIEPTITSHGNPGFITGYKWRKVNDPATILATTLNYSTLDTGLYYLEVAHDGCQDYDTIFIDTNTEVLWSNLSYEIGAEHCINMNDGFIEYDTTSYPTSVHFYWTPSMISSNETILDSLGTGTHNYFVFDDLNRCSSMSDFVPINYDSCSIIKGVIYNDTNLTCIMDSLEVGIENITVYTTPLNNISVTDSLGRFEILVPPGTYDLNQNLLGNIAIGEYCSIGPLNVPVSGLTLDSINLGDTIRQYIHNPTLSSLSATPIATNFPTSIVQFTVANQGDSLDNITCGLHINHPILSYGIQPPEFQGMIGDTAMYLFSNMPGSSSLTRQNKCLVAPNVAYIGDTVTLQMSCYGTYGDIDTTNNDLTYQRIVLAAYDPNLKSVTPLGEGVNHKTHVLEREFTYTIHFQNTGNAPAETVVVLDTISNKLDLSTLLLMGSSHDVVVSSYTGVLEFRFDNIDLPDSTTNEPESKGFVQFSISSDTLTGVGDTIENNANIYFDNNPPIVTPYATNIYYKPATIIDTIATSCLGGTIQFYNQTYSATGIYTDTIVGEYSDSVFVANITMIPPDDIQVSASICPGDSIDFYGTFISNEGFYPYTMTNMNGCDSVETMQLVHYIVDSTQVIMNLCTGDSIDFYGTFISDEGFYPYTLTDMNGCDSVETVQLIHYVIDSSETVMNICPGDSIDFYGSFISDEGFYQQTLTSIYGCDSVETAELIYHPVGFTETLMDLCTGQSFNFYGTEISSGGSYNYQMTNSFGCDSVEWLIVSMVASDTAVNYLSPLELTALVGGNSYQWYNCTEQQDVVGATGQVFLPIVNGSYAVIVDNGICLDTSSCYLINTVGLNNVDLNAIIVQPNPTTGLIHISHMENNLIRSVSVLNDLGESVQNRMTIWESSIDLMIVGEAGTYFIVIETEDGNSKTVSVIKI